MEKYFKIVPVSFNEFLYATGELLDCEQLVVPVDCSVYVAVDTDSLDEIVVSLSCFD